MTGPRPAALEPTPTVVSRIADFVAGRGTTPFDTLVREAFAYQLDHLPPLRRLCRSQGVEPTTIRTWRDIPATPTTAFASVPLHTATAHEVFRSSGTTGATRSVHRHPFPDLYRTVVDASFPTFCLPTLTRPAMLSLVPPRDIVPDSSLGFMVDHVLTRFGAPTSGYAFDADGPQPTAATAWCRARREDGQPVLILTTAFALVHWLDALEDQGLRLDLPPGSVLFETGGFKGKSRELDRAALVASIARWLGIPGRQVVREYGMTELTSQLYSRALSGGDPSLLVGPAWVRVRVLDPLTLEEQPTGTPGLIAIFDLANVGSALHLLTEDLGRDTGDGLELIGRASGAALRGCSLTAEAMATAAGRIADG